MLARPPVRQPSQSPSPSRTWRRLPLTSLVSRRTRTAPARTVTAKRPNHVWNIDTSDRTEPGGSVGPLDSFSLAPSWPFCWHVAVVFNHFARYPVAFRVFRTNPSAVQLAELLDSAVKRAGGWRPPRHIISDRGSQSWHGSGPSQEYGAWCKRHGVRPRFGAVGKKGSIAVLERFWRSLKGECTRRIIVPFDMDAMHFELDAYLRWYSVWRPHAVASGARLRTNLPGADTNVVRLETRPRYPLPTGRDSPEAERAAALDLSLSYLDGCRHLPCIEIRRAA